MTIDEQLDGAVCRVAELTSQLHEAVAALVRLQANAAEMRETLPPPPDTERSNQ